MQLNSISDSKTEKNDFEFKISERNETKLKQLNSIKKKNSLNLRINKISIQPIYPGT